MRKRLACACVEASEAGRRTPSVRSMSAVTRRPATKASATTSSVTPASAPKPSVSLAPMPSFCVMRACRSWGGAPCRLRRQTERFPIGAALGIAPEADRDLLEVDRGRLQRRLGAELAGGRFGQVQVQRLPVAVGAGDAQVGELLRVAEGVVVGLQVVADVGLVPAVAQVGLQLGRALRLQEVRAPAGVD